MLKFFLNSGVKGHLRGLEKEFGENNNAIRLELNRLEEAGMLSSEKQGNKKLFSANLKHPLYKEIHNIVLKHFRLDRFINNIITRLGDVENVFLGGDFAKGVDCPIVDVHFVGNLNSKELVGIVTDAEKVLGRKIRYLVFSSLDELNKVFKDDAGKLLLLWTAKSSDE